MKRSTRRRSGNSLIEFTILGIPIVCISISIVMMALDMWQFHNLAWAVDSTARYVSLHGAGCSQNGNSCTVTVANIATYFEQQSMALNSGSAILTLTNNAGTVTTCNPVSNCSSTSTQFPDSTNNAEGSNITVSATYTLKNPFFLYWPPNADQAGDFTVGATSQQMIVF